MPEIFYILQMRIEKTHQLDDGIGITAGAFLYPRASAGIRSFSGYDDHTRASPDGSAWYYIPCSLYWASWYYLKTNLQEKARIANCCGRRASGGGGVAAQSGGPAWLAQSGAAFLINEDLAHKAPIMGKVGRPQKIESFHRLRVKVQLDLAGSGQRDRLFLYDLAGRIDQLQHEPSCLVTIELEH